MKPLSLRVTAAVVWLGAFPASAHHSYAVFDRTKSTTVTGTVAKLELTNPHGYVWVYVPNSESPNGYDLYSFENGPPGVMARVGWTQDTLRPGEKISVEYWPLKDGRTGGHLLKVTHADGRITPGDPGLRGVAVDSEPPERKPQ